MIGGNDREEPPSSPPPGADGVADEGGDAACWAHLLCPECGAVLSGGHREGCALGDEPLEG